MSLPLSTQEVLEKLKAGEPVSVCDIMGSGQMEGQRGQEARAAALVAWVTNAAGSGSSDALLASILEAFNSTVNPSGRQLVEPLGQPSEPLQLAAGVASINTALTTTCRRISIRAVGANVRYMIGSTSQTANAATSHLIADGERLDLAVPATPNIAVIRAAATNGTLEVSELI